MPRRVVITVLVAACAVLANAAIGTPAQAAGPGTIIASEDVGCPIAVVRARDLKRLRCYATPGLGRAALPLAVAPGGDRVAFYAEKNGAPGFDNGLYELSLRTGRVRELVPPSVGLRRSAEPVYSPDGLRLAFDGTEKQLPRPPTTACSSSPSRRRHASAPGRNRRTGRSSRPTAAASSSPTWASGAPR
jgi:hypothetical protein